MKYSVNTNLSMYRITSICFVFLGLFSACRGPITFNTVRNRIEIKPAAGRKDCHTLIQYAIQESKARRIDTIFFKSGLFPVSSPILPEEGVFFLGENKEKVVIEQRTWGYPAFDVFNRPNVSISNLTILSKQPRIYPNGFVSRGTDAFVNNAGIYSNSHNGAYSHLVVRGFTCGLFLSSWNGSGLYEQKMNNHLYEIQVDKVDFGVLATGQKYLSIRNLTGTYEQQKGSNAAPHLIYISDANDPAYAWTEDFEIANCFAKDGLGGHAFQIGAARNGHMSNLNALRCTGILAIENFVNVVIDTLVALEDKTHEVGSVFIQPVNVENVKMNYVRIETLNPKARLLRLDGKNNIYTNIILQTPIDHVDDLALITVEGERSEISNVSIRSLSNEAGAIGVRLQGQYLKLQNIDCTSCRAGFTIAMDCQQCSAIFNSKKIGAPKNFKEFAFYYDQSTTAKITDKSNL